MQAIIAAAVGPPHDVLRWAEAPDPQPGPGQVRVRMLASPINPSDLRMISGTYGTKIAPPFIPGFEGVGVVTEGQGWLVRRLIGRRCSVLAPYGGLWGESAVVAATRCIPVPAELPDEQAAMFFINPATAYALTRCVLRVPRGAWLLQSAAASAVGRLICRLGREFGFRTANVVRREAQAEPVRAAGGDAVFVAGNPEQLQGLPDAVRAACGDIWSAVDPVGGATGGALLRALGPGGRLVAYGTLDEAPIAVQGRDLMTRGVSLSGFWLGPWLEGRSLLQKLDLVMRLRGLAARGVLGGLPAEVFAASRIREAVQAAERPGRERKIVLKLG